MAQFTAPARHLERHAGDRISWLRAAVLGANDGILSTASLIVGVAAASASMGAILLAGIAGMAAGAMSMAAGEYVSVSSQRDAEHADLARERQELRDTPELELHELAGIYQQRGLDPALALQVATQLTAHDALAAHARDELGITELGTARPIQAALASAASFAIGAALPLLSVLVFAGPWLVPAVLLVTLLALTLLGAVGALAGGAAWLRPTARVVFWGALAMLLTAGIGKLFDVAV